MEESLEFVESYFWNCFRGKERDGFFFFFNGMEESLEFVES